MALADARRILWCLRYGIGDVVMQMPALDALRRACPDAHLTAVGARPAMELVEQDARVDRLVDVAGFGLTHWGDYGDEWKRAAMRDWIVEQSFDTALDPSHAAVGFRLAVGAADVPRIYDTGNGLEDRIVATGCSGLSALRAAVREGWGLALDEEALPRVETAPEELEWAAGIAEGSGWVALSPVASSPLKQWPMHRLKAVADYLRRCGWRCLLLAGDAAEPPAGPWRVVPATSLRRTAALLARCRLLVANDTGLMHLAAAAGTPVVALFGPTHPRVYLPPGGRALCATTPCAVRHTDRFGPPACVAEGGCRMGVRSCIDEIAADDVVAALQAETGGTLHGA